MKLTPSAKAFQILSALSSATPFNTSSAESDALSIVLALAVPEKRKTTLSPCCWIAHTLSVLTITLFLFIHIILTLDSLFSYFEHQFSASN